MQLDKLNTSLAFHFFTIRLCSVQKMQLRPVFNKINGLTFKVSLPEKQSKEIFEQSVNVIFTLSFFVCLFFFNGCASQYFSSDETLCLLTETKRHLRNRNLGDRSLSLKRWSVLPVFKLFLYQINSNRSHLITGSFERNCIICFLRLGFRWSICSIGVWNAIWWTIRQCLVSVLVVHIIHFCRLTWLNLVAEEIQLYYIRLQRQEKLTFLHISNVIKWKM